MLGSERRQVGVEQHTLTAQQVNALGNLIDGQRSLVKNYNVVKIL